MKQANGLKEESGHRPWPLPSDPWIIFQSWQRLLFAHWPLSAEELRPLVPEPLEIEEFDGSAWVGVIPFMLKDFRPRMLPALSRLSDFPEVNVRTYVRYRGKPGVYFFSLDAASALAVSGARTFFALPYFRADMEIGEEEGWINYRSRRVGAEAELVARYHPTGEAFNAAEGTLDHFLTERYCLYTVLRSGGVLRVDIHHAPWPLQPAEAEIESNTLAAAAGIELPATEPTLHYAPNQDVLTWGPKHVG